jgi:predicted amidohydrolase
MRVAIISNRVTSDYQDNNQNMLNLAAKAVDDEAQLILFPEAAATGLVSLGDVAADLRIAESVPGPRNEEWRTFASENGVFFAAGLLEREGKCIYDSALIYGPDGKLMLRYRRNDPGWHLPGDDPNVYREGSDIPIAVTDFGTIAFLICGDLWNDAVLGKLAKMRPDYILYIFARGLSVSRDIEQEWRKEMESYRERWRKCGSKILAANLLNSNPPNESVGGAWYVDNRGRLVASSPVLKESILLVDL